MNNTESTDISASIRHLLNKVQSLQLATMDTEGQARVSYTPYLMQQGAFFIFVSELANHTRNMRENPSAELMVIEDEAESQNIFTRKRLILQCQCTFVGKNDSGRDALLQAFEERHGKTVALLRTLPDFWPVKLVPTSGRFVQGFAQAYSFSHMDFASAQAIGDN